jgi:predicted RNA-binding protein (virulence factor B family)
MIVPGKRWDLTVVREAAPGLYLDGLNLGEILLPGAQIPAGTKPGDMLGVFVHHDSEDRLVATTKMPFAQLNQVAGFEVVAVRPGIGAFLNWGLDKDLLLPLREQTRSSRTGDWVVAIVRMDEVSGRLIASCRLDRHLQLSFPEYQEGQAVSLVIAEETALGFKAVVNHTHWGLLYHSELCADLVPGDEIDGYIRSVREDGKIDLRLDPAGYERVGPLARKILAALKTAGGTLPFNDQSTPEAIRNEFGTSKKAFKQALGMLLREGRIHFVEAGFSLGRGASQG